MRKIFILFVILIGFTNIFALGNEYFTVNMTDKLAVGSDIDVEVKDLENIKSLDLVVSDIKLKLYEAKGNHYVFKFPEGFKINTLNKNISISSKFDGGDSKTYKVDGFFPTFKGIDLTDLTGGKQVEIFGELTGSCKFYVNDDIWGLSNKDKKYFVTIPKVIKKSINGGYINCNGLSSYYKSFYIPKSPKLTYLITKSNTKIIPGDTVLLQGTDIFLNDKDDVVLLLNGKKIDYKKISNNKLEVKLPYKNLVSAKFKVIRNGFESNELSFSVNSYSFIKNVLFTTEKGHSIFRIYGDFDFDLGDIEVYFGSRKLTVSDHKTIEGMSYIDVKGPINPCDYLLEPNYFVVKIGGTVSNGFFYTPENKINIVYVKPVECRKGECKLQAYLDTSSKNIKLLLNGSEVPYTTRSNEYTITFDNNIVKKGTLQVVSYDCIKSPKYYFNYENRFKPIINYIESDSNFKSQHEFVVYGDNLVGDGTRDFGAPKFITSPDIIKDFSYDGTMKATIKYGIKNDTKVSAYVATKHGKSNTIDFVVGGKNKYFAAPIIKNISYKDGGEGGKVAKIVGLGFSNTCTNNKIYFDGKVVYPTVCTPNYLSFNIPDMGKSDSIQVDVNNLKSNIYKLHTKIGGTIVDKKLDIVGANKTKIINISSSKQQEEFNFNIKNTLTDIYIPSIKFNIENIDFSPVGSVVLEINGNSKRVMWSHYQDNITLTNDENIGYIKKTKTGYEIEFKNIYIPFSTDEINAKIKFDLTKGIKNNTVLKIGFPEQEIYYYNIFDSSKVLRNKFTHSFTHTYKIINSENVCFDSNPNFQNCALILRGEKIKPDTKQDTIVKPSKPVVKPSKPIKKPTTKKNITKKERIAKKLNKSKMELLNKLIKKYLIKMKRRYRTHKSKLRYVVFMYKGYIYMVKHTSDDMGERLKYVKGLFYFAKAYMKFKAVK